TLVCSSRCVKRWRRERTRASAPIPWGVHPLVPLPPFVDDGRVFSPYRRPSLQLRMQVTKEAPMRTCSEVMTKNPVCCLPGDPVAKVAQLMKSTDIGSVPIIDDERSKRLIGIVTDRDLVVKMVAEGRDAETARAEEVMSRGVVTCHAQD